MAKKKTNITEETTEVVEQILDTKPIDLKKDILIKNMKTWA